MSEELQEALTAAGASALIQKVISPVLLEYERRYSPMIRTIPTQKLTSNIYYFNKRTTLVPGGFVTDGGARPVGTSTYVQAPFTIRNLQSVGAVTGYAQNVTADLIGDLRAREIEGAARGMLWDIENGIDWGNSAATVNGPYPQFDGFDTLCSTFTGSDQNAINFATGSTDAAFTTGILDNVIDLVENNVAEEVQNPNWCFVVSPTVNSVLAQLFVNQQRFVNVQPVEVAAGLIVPSYRNIPIIKSSFLSPRGQVMPAVTTAPTNTGGFLAAGVYQYRVSAIESRYGEIQASAEVAATVSGGASYVTLSFTPPSGPEGAVPTLYKVWRSAVGGGAGNETLLGVVDANVAVASDGVTPIVTNQIIDNGVTLIAQNSVGPVQQTNPVAAYVNSNTALNPPSAGAQSIYLMPLDPNYLLRPYVRNMVPIDIYPTTASPDSLPFAFMSDTCIALRAPKYMGRAANVTATLAV